MTMLLRKHIDYLIQATDRPTVRMIESYLNELDYDTLVWLETLMYYGSRDDNIDIYDQHKYFSKRKDSKDDIVTTIVGKSISLPYNFDKAINKLEEQNMDVDKL